MKKRPVRPNIIERRSLSERWFVAGYSAALLVALLVIFRHFVFSDRMLLSYDLLGYGLWQRTLLRDFLTSLHTIPLWNPYVLCGLPFVESIHGGVFYPLSYVDYLGYLPRMVGFNFLLHFWLAGIFAYCAARQFKLSRLCAAVVGVAYAFSPLVLSWVGPGHEGKIYSSTLFPLVMLFLDRIFDREGYMAMALLGIILGLVIVTPHLQIAYYMVWCVAGFSVYKAIDMIRHQASIGSAAGRLAKVAAALILALMLSAVQWLPSSNYIMESSPRSVEERGVKFAATFSNHFEELVSLALPDFCGIDQMPAYRTYWGRNSFRDNSESAGTVTCFLAVLGILLGRWREKIWWVVSAAIVIIYSLGTTTPAFGLLVSIVPLLDSMRAPSTSMFIALFGIAMLAGLGVGRAIEHLQDRSKSLAKGLQFTLLGVPALCVVVAAAAAVLGSRLIVFYARIVYPELLSADTAHWDYAVKNLPFLQTGLWTAAVCLIIVSSLFYVIRKFRLHSNILAIVPLLIVGANGLFVQRCINLGDLKSVYDPNPISLYLTEHCGIDRALPINVSSDQMKIGYTSVPTEVGWHSRDLLWYYQLIGGSGCPYYKNPRLTNLTGTKYIVASSRGQTALTNMGFQVSAVFTLGNHAIFENSAAFPRAFLVDSYTVTPDLKTIQREVITGITDLRQIALLEDEVKLPILPGDNRGSSATVSYYSPDSVEVAVQCRNNMLLILTDNWYPSWHASVDGVERPIHRAYGSFRGVEVPAGARKVVFSYYSRSFEIGKYLTITGLLIVVGILGYRSMRLKRRSQKN